MTRKIWIVLLGVVLIGCSPTNNTEEKTEPTTPTAFELVTSEIELLLPLIRNNNLIIDSSVINSYVNAYALVKENKLYRSKQNFGGITLNRIFNTNNDTITSVHFDFYYDSTITSLRQNVDSLLNYFVDELGGFKSTFNEKMAIHSWSTNNYIFDFEVFNNGYTLTIRKGKETIRPIVPEEKIAEHFFLSEKLISYILTDSIKLNETTKDGIKTLFPFDLLEKKNALSFNKTYNKQILLSASFLFEEEKLIGLYFDYMYSDIEVAIVISDSKIAKKLLTKAFGLPSEVATTKLSTYYKWDNKPINLDVYSDGFSIVLEASNEL